MADKTKIEWSEATWNPLVGCSVVSPGCTNCYAMKFAGSRLQHIGRYAGLTQPTKAGPVWTGEVRLVEEALLQPLRWTRPRMIFVNSMSDLFHESVPDEWIDKVFAVMALAPQHTFQVLTKRADRMRAYVQKARAEIWERAVDIGGALNVPWPLPNVWLGVSAEDQRRADERIPDLLATPAAVRWVSAEPLLGPIDFGQLQSGLPANAWLTWLDGMHWIVVGGESGRDARPMAGLWVREIREQCAAAGVAFFFKQWGEWAPCGNRPSEAPGRFAYGAWEHDPGRLVQVEQFPRQMNLFGARALMERIGKKRAGRMLDGKEHNAMPEVRQ